MNLVQPNAAFDAACRTSEGFGRAILTYVYLGLGCWQCRRDLFLRVVGRAASGSYHDPQHGFIFEGLGRRALNLKRYTLNLTQINHTP